MGGGVQEPTLHDVVFAYGLTLSIVSTVMLWTRCIVAMILFTRNRIAKTTCPRSLSKLSHFLYATSLLACDAVVVYAWRVAPGDSASPPILPWMAFWFGINLFSMVGILIGILIVSKAPIMWHTSCTAYALACVYYLVDGIIRDDITAAMMFAVPPVILGGFVVCYNSIHLTIPRVVLHAIKKGHYGPDEQEDEAYNSDSDVEAGKGKDKSRILTIRKNGKWLTISTDKKDDVPPSPFSEQRRALIMEGLSSGEEEEDEASSPGPPHPASWREMKNMADPASWTEPDNKGKEHSHGE